MLIRQNVLTEDELKKALELQKGSGKKIGEVLVDNGFITEDMIVRALQMQLGLKVVQLTGVTIPKEVRNLVSVDILKKYTCIPFELDPYNANILHLAMADPMDMAAIDDISIVTNLQIEPYIATTRDILAAIDRCYGASETLDAARRFTQERAQLRGGAADDDTDTDVSDAPIVQLVRSLIEQAIRQRASDIHIEPQEDDTRVRFRVDGVLRNAVTLPKNSHSAIISRIKIMAEMDIAEKRLPQDGRINIEQGGRDIDLRISTLPTILGEKVVMRILDKTAASIDINDLAFTAKNMELYSSLFNSSYGIVLVTGPTGSGKSTTLYSTLTNINNPNKNIITVEDPVEYRIEGVNQVAVNNKAGLTFANGLRSILRQDPNIIMVGEIRDVETARISIHAALTGHLVFSTLHTNDAAGAITRLIDMGVEPFLVASALRGVVAQRLVRRICPHCKETYAPDAAERAYMGIALDEEVKLYKGAGCGKCNFTGYAGRMAIHEVLPIIPEMKELILKNAPDTEIFAAGRSYGVTSMKEDGIRKVLDGETTASELLRVAYA